MGQLVHSQHVGTNGHSNGQPGRTIRSFAPATGELLGEAPILDAQAVDAMVERAHRAQESWRALPVTERAARVLHYRDAIIGRQDEVVELLSRECGKPKHEALIHEVAVVASVATHFAKVAPNILTPRAISTPMMPHRKSQVVYTPRGVVAVVSPWNYPFQLPLRDTIIALIAGNAVVLKPSEVTPLIALLAKDIWDAAGLPEDVFQVATGDGTTGAALINAGRHQPKSPDATAAASSSGPATAGSAFGASKPRTSRGGVQFLVFTGGVETGRRVAAACGERLIPCVMELGGKAPLIACADADIERTANAIVFGGFSNAGQACVSVERVYAHRNIYDRLVARVVDLTETLRMGDPSTGDIDVGAIIFPRQIEVAAALITDAVGKGAEVCTGGSQRRGPGQFFEPTVLSDCDHTMAVMTDEIFGPIVPFMRVSSEEEAVRLANSSNLGLNAYVFSRDRKHAVRVAERLEAGSVLVNDVLSNGGQPQAPFGGLKDSGFGRVMGDDSLREMCDTRHISVDRLHTAKEPTWFPYTPKSLARAQMLTRALFTRGGPLKKLIELF